jgi:hypothetical protein
MDLGLEITPEKAKPVTEYGTYRIHEGHLIRPRTTTVQAKYRLNNRSPKPRTLLLDHLPEPEYEVVGKNKPVEQVKGIQRYEWKIAPKTIIEESVTEQSTGEEKNLVSSLSHFYVNQIAENATTSKPVQDALRKALEFRARVQVASDTAGKDDARIKAILTEQERIRTGIYHLPKDSAAHKRLLAKFDTLEVELEKVRESSRAKTAAYFALEKEYLAFLTKLEAK